MLNKQAGIVDKLYGAYLTANGSPTDGRTAFICGLHAFSCFFDIIKEQTGSVLPDDMEGLDELRGDDDRMRETAKKVMKCMAAYQSFTNEVKKAYHEVSDAGKVDLQNQ